MPRFLYAAAQSASTEAVARLRWLVDLTLTNSTFKLCTGFTPVAWGVNTYTPVGRLGGLEQIEEAGDLYPRAMRMWISAVGSAQLYEPLTENLFNKNVTVYRALLNAQGIAVSTPEQRFRGRINVCNVHLKDAAKGNYVEIEVESRLRLEPRSARFNKEYLWLTHSGDTFFNYVPEIEGFVGQWGIQQTLFSLPFPTSGVRGRIPPGR